MPAVILYDGACRACQAAVRIVLPRDPAGRFRFASQDSALGRRLLAEHGLAGERGRALVLLEDGRAFVASDAALRVAAGLRGPLRLLGLLRAVPLPLRDAAYRLFARHRRLLGGAPQCLALGPAERERFLDLAD